MFQYIITFQQNYQLLSSPPMTLLQMHTAFAPSHVTLQLSAPILPSRFHSVWHLAPIPHLQHLCSYLRKHWEGRRRRKARGVRDGMKRRRRKEKVPRYAAKKGGWAIQRPTELRYYIRRPLPPPPPVETRCHCPGRPVEGSRDEARSPLDLCRAPLAACAPPLPPSAA